MRKRQFSNQRNQAIERFQTFISQGKGQEIWRDLKHQIYLGDKDFVEKHRVHLAKQEGNLSEVPLKQRRKPAKTLKEYEEGNATRNDAIFAAFQSGGYTMNEIAEYFGCHYSTVSRAVAKCKT
jgi:putative transposase